MPFLLLVVDIISIGPATKKLKQGVSYGLYFENYNFRGKLGKLNIMKRNKRGSLPWGRQRLK